MDKRLEEIYYIRDEMLTNPKVNAQTILNASKIAEEDNYLYELMIDWMKVVDDHIKLMLMDEVVNYTEEIVRKMKVRNEL